MRKSALRVCSVLLITISPAFAQVDDKARSLRQRLFDPTLQSPVSAPGVELSLTGTREEQDVTARIGLQYGDLLLDFKLKGPLSKGQKQATLLNEGGLQDGVTGDFGLGWVFWDPSADAAKQGEICRSYYRAKEGTDKREPCTWLTLPAGSDYRDRFDDAINWGTPVLLFGRVKVGRKEFQFAESTTLAQSSVMHSSLALTGSFGIIPSSIGYLGVNYTYSRSHREKQDEPAEVCTPITPDSIALECRVLSIGAPVRKLEHTIQAEVRKLTSFAGFNPKFSYNFKNDVKTVQVPIYIFRSKQSFNGGVTVGWRSDHKGVLFNAFIGDLFGLIPSR